MPINFKKDFFENIRISAGDLSGDNVLLQLGTDCELTVPPKIFVSGHKAEPTAPKPDFNIYGKNWYAFKIPQAAFGMRIVVEMCFSSEHRLEYAEIFAEPEN